MEYLFFDIACFEPLFDEFLPWNRTNGLEQVFVRDMVEGAAYICVQDPFLGLVWSSQSEDFLDRVMSTAPRSKSVAGALELGFPEGFEGVLDHCLKAAVLNDGDSEWP